MHALGEAAPDHDPASVFVEFDPFDHHARFAPSTRAHSLLDCTPLDPSLCR